jgi:hypothetical protein
VCRATCVQWGDHAFYPFFYSIQAHYLIEPFELHPVAYLAIVAVFFTGYTIFRQCASLSLFSFFPGSQRRSSHKGRGGGITRHLMRCTGLMPKDM